MLKVFLSSDHVTAATGKTVAITISKNGGAFGNPNAGATNATEVSSGWYKVTLDTTDTNTIGDLVVRGTATACDDSEQVMEVVSATTGGASNLDVASSTLATASSLATVAGYLDTEIADIKAKTDNLPSDPADASVIAARFDTLDTSVADLPTNAELATALAAADDAVLAAIAGLNDISAAEVNAEVDTALADYDAPTKAELDTAIGLVTAKTDSLTFTVSGVLDANTTYVAGTAVTGAGTEADPWGP